jgi:hypothetical protein
VQHLHGAQVAVVVTTAAEVLNLQEHVHGVTIVGTRLLNQALVLKVSTKVNLQGPHKHLSKLQQVVGIQQQLLES